MMPFTARMKSADRQAESIPVDHGIEQALVFGVNSGAGVLMQPDKAAAFGKALPAGSEGFVDDKIIIRAVVSAAARGAGPSVEDQKPFSVCGRGESQQQAGGNKCFHGEYILKCGG